MSTVEERFWAKVEKTPGCWNWTAGRSSNGYGAFHIAGRVQVKAHRWAYESVRGPIPEGLQIDHLCRNRACVNPEHLEAVTLVENVMRGFSPQAVNARRTVCSRGHEYKWRSRSNGKPRRWCPTCHAINTAERRRRVRA